MSVQIYFGVPGSGKTTHAAKIVLRNLTKGIRTYSNVIIKGAIKIDASKIGSFQMENGDLIIDEASIEYNNRAYKSLPKTTLEWFKLYRHYGIRNIFIYSQSYDDMDITLRRLSDVMYLQKRTLIPGLFVAKRIIKKIGINSDSHQIEDQYSFRLLSFKFTWGPKYWKMFDSWSAPHLSEIKMPIIGTDYNSDQFDSKMVLSAIKKKSKVIRRGKKDD